MKRTACIPSISLALLIGIAHSVVPLQAQNTIRNGKMAVTSAKVRLKYKKYDEALVVLEEGRRVDPDCPTLYPLLGSLYVRKGEYARADTAFDRAVELDGGLAEDVKAARMDAWSKLVNRGAESMRAEKFDEAIGLLNSATIIRPEGAEAWINLGAAYTNSNRPREAVAPFRKALDLDSENTNVMIDLAHVYGLLERPDSARVYYRALLERQPDNMEVKTAMAAGYLREGKADSAATLYAEIMSQDEVDPTTAFNYGILQIQMENWPEAERAFRIVIEQNPDDVEALENVSVAMMQQQKYREVIPYLERITRSDDSNLEAWGSLVIAYAQIGENEKASHAHEKYSGLGGE